MKYSILFLSFILLFSSPPMPLHASSEKQAEQDSIAKANQAVTAVKTVSDQPATEVSAPEEPGDTAGIIAGLIGIFNEARQSYADGKLMGLLFYILGILGTIKVVYFTRAWAWVRRYFIMQDIKTIVKGVSLLVSFVITLLVGGGVFNVERFIMLASIIWLASDPVYNLLVSWRWIKKTPKVVVSN